MNPRRRRQGSSKKITHYDHFRNTVAKLRDGLEQLIRMLSRGRGQASNRYKPGSERDGCLVN
jgi:hypothetical protein